MSQTIKQGLSCQNEKLNDTEENNFDEDLDEEINGYLNQLEEIPLDLFDETCGNSSDGSKNTQNTVLETPKSIDTQHLVHESSLPPANNEKSETAASISLLAKTILSVLEKKKEDFKKTTLDGSLNENLSNNDVFLQLSAQISKTLDRKIRQESRFVNKKVKSSESLSVGPSRKNKRDGITSKKMTNNTKLHLEKKTTPTVKTEKQELRSHIEDGIKTQVVAPVCSVVKQEPKDDDSKSKVCVLKKGRTMRKRRNSSSSSSSSSSLSGMETVILPTRVSRLEQVTDVPFANEHKGSDLSCVSSSESLLQKMSDNVNGTKKREPSPFPISKNSRKNSVDDKSKESVRVLSDCSKVSSVSELDFEMEQSLEQNHEPRVSPTFHRSRSRTRSKQSHSRSRSRTMSLSPRRKSSHSPSRRPWKSSADNSRDGRTFNLKTQKSHSKSPPPILRSVIGFPSEKNVSLLKHSDQKSISRTFDDQKVHEESKVPEANIDNSEKESSKSHEAKSETVDNTALLNSETLDSSDSRNLISYRSLSPSSSNGSRSPRRRRRYRSNSRSRRKRKSRWGPSRSPPRGRRRSNSGSPRRKRLRYRRSFSRSISPRRRRSRSRSRSPYRRSPLRKRDSRSRSPYWKKSYSPEMSSKRSHSPWSSPRRHRRSSSMSISPSPDNRRTKLKEHAVNSLVAALKGASASAAVESLVAVLSGSSPATLSRTSTLKALALPTTDPTLQVPSSAALLTSNQILSTAKDTRPPTSLPALPEPPKPVPPVQCSETQQIRVHTGYPYPSHPPHPPHGDISMSPDCYPSYQYNHPPPPLPAAPYSDAYYQGGYEGAGSSYIVSTSVQHTYGPYNQMSSYQHQTYFQSPNLKGPVPFMPSVPPPPPPGEQPPLPPPLPTEDYPPPPPPEPEPLSDDVSGGLPVLNSMNRRKMVSNFVSPLINRLQSNLRYLLPEVTKNKPSPDALKVIDKALRSPEKVTSSSSSSSSLSPIRCSPASEDGLSHSNDNKLPINVPKMVDYKTVIEKHSKQDLLSSESFKLSLPQTVKDKSSNKVPEAIVQVPHVSHQMISGKISALGDSDADCEMMTEEIKQPNMFGRTKPNLEDPTHRKCKPVVLKLLPRKTLPICSPSTLFQSDDSDHELVPSKSNSNQIIESNQDRKEDERNSSKKMNMLEPRSSEVHHSASSDVYSSNSKIQSSYGKTPHSSQNGIFSSTSNTLRTLSRSSGSEKCLASRETSNKAHSPVGEIKEKSKTMSQITSKVSSPLTGTKIPTLNSSGSSSNIINISNNNSSRNNNLIVVKTEPDLSNKSIKQKFQTSVVSSCEENTVVTVNTPTSAFKVKQEENCTSFSNRDKEIASKLLTETSKTGRKQNLKTVEDTKKENKEVTHKVKVEPEGSVSGKGQTERKAADKVKDVIIKNECLLESTDEAVSTNFAGTTNIPLPANLVDPTDIPLPRNLVDPTSIPLPNCSSPVKSTRIEDQVKNIVGLPKDKEHSSLSVATDLVNQNTPVSPSGNKENLSLNIPNMENSIPSSSSGENSNPMTKIECLVTSGNVLSENAMDKQHCESILQPSGNSESGKKDDLQENAKQLQNSIPIGRKTDTSQLKNSENGVQTVPNLSDKSAIKEEKESDGISAKVLIPSVVTSSKKSKCRTNSTSKKQKQESELNDSETTVGKSVNNIVNTYEQKNVPTTSLNVEVLETMSKALPTDIKCKPKSKICSQKENITDKHERTCNTTNQKKDLKLNIVEKQVDNVAVSKAVNELSAVHMKPSTVVSKALSADKKCESGDRSLKGNVISEHKRRKVHGIKKIKNLFCDTERKIILGASHALSDPKLMKCAVIMVERYNINKNCVKKNSCKLELETTGNYSTSEDEHVRQLEKSREDAHKLPSKEPAVHCELEKSQREDAHKLPSKEPAKKLHSELEKSRHEDAHKLPSKEPAKRLHSELEKSQREDAHKLPSKEPAKKLHSELEKSQREDAHKLPSKEPAKRLHSEASSTSAENSLADTNETVVLSKDKSINAVSRMHSNCGKNDVNSISDKEALQQAIKLLNISNRTINTQVNIVKGVLCGSEEVAKKSGSENRRSDLVSALERILRFMPKNESAE